MLWYSAVTIGFRWLDSTLSAGINSFSQLVLGQMKAMATDAGKFVTFNYANNAGKADPIFTALPTETQERLKAVSQKYDPNGVFQNLVPGFKL
jgi:hypothetical protein